MQVYQSVYVLCHILTVSVVAFSGGRVIPHYSQKDVRSGDTVWSVRWAAAQLIAIWGFSYTFFLPLYMLELPPEAEAIANTFLTFAIILAASIVSVWSVNQFLQLKANKREWLPYVVIPEVGSFVLHLVVSTPLTLAIFFASVVGVMFFGIWYFVHRYNIYKRLILEEYSDLTDRELRWVWGLLAAMALQSANFIAVCVFNAAWLEFFGMLIVCCSSIILQQCAFRTKALSPYLIEQAAVADNTMLEADRTPDVVQSDDLDQIMATSVETSEAASVDAAANATDDAASQANDKDAAADKKEVEATSDAPAAEDPRQKVYEVIRRKLQTVCEDEGLFLDPDLTRETLCSAIKVNRTYLSEYLRSEGLTYYNYINGLRIHYAVQLLRSNPDLPLLDVSFRSGFSNPATFRRAFRDIMGCLPSEYQA